MPHPDDFDRKIRELEESNRILRIENDELAERAEDTLLLGLIAEQIGTAEEIGPVLERGLERISVLKDIPFCACCSLTGNEAVVIKSYLSFSDEDMSNRAIVLPDALLQDIADGEFLLDHGVREYAGLSIKLASGIFKPASVCCIPFFSRYAAANLFLFADDRLESRFPKLLDMLHRVVEMTASRIDNVVLLQELRSLNRALDNTVEERTRELRKREHEFRSLAENLPDNIVRYDREGRSVYVNPVLEKTLGADGAPMIGKRVREIFPDGSYEVYAQTLDATLASGQNGEIELLVPVPDKTTIVHQIRFIAERDEHGEVTGALAIGRDITERKRAEAALAASEQQFRSLAENSPDNVVRYDRQCRARYYNPRMLKTIGVAPETILGKTPVELGAGGPESDTEYEVHIRRVLESGESNDMELTLQLPGGGVSNHLIRFTPERDAQGAIIGVLAIGRDVTGLKRAEEEIRILNQELEQRVTDRTVQLEAANRELEAFSYSVSHDLRTPLRAIDGFSHILLEDYAGKLDEEGKRLFNVVRNNTNRMGQLIDDILQFSRTGRSEMKLSEIDMEKMAREVLEELQSMVAKGAQLQFEIEHIPHAMGDRAMMRQVFVNLFSNAIKFSRTSEISKVIVGASVKEKETIYFVKDNGVGFDMQYADKLFGVFQRLHSADEFEGTGIGLAIVKRIITRHGGRVWAEGKVNEGATIYFSVPATAQALNAE